MTLAELTTQRDTADDTLSNKQLTAAIELVEFQRRLYGEDFESILTITPGYPGAKTFSVKG
jgi:hypothetical protein